jgi:hypothetical protein
MPCGEADPAGQPCPSSDGTPLWRRLELLGDADNLPPPWRDASGKGNGQAGGKPEEAEGSASAASRLPLRACRARQGTPARGAAHKRIAAKVPAHRLQRAFAALLLTVALLMLADALW